MNGIKLGVAAMGLGTVLVGAQPARAAITYSYYFPEPAYSVGEGGTVQLPIYLQETVDDAAADTPLFGADVGLIYASFVLSMSDGDVAFSSFSADAAWELADAQPSSPGMYDVVLFSPIASSIGVEAEADDPATRRILLGNLVLQANGMAGQSTDVLALLDPARGLAAEDNTIIDSALSADVTVSIVPEPISGGTLGLAATFALVAGRRGSRRD